MTRGKLAFVIIEIKISKTSDLKTDEKNETGFYYSK